MNQRLTVAVEVMFVIRIALLVSVSHSLKFVTVDYMPKITAPSLSIYLKKFYDIYLRSDFAVDLFLMDIKF